MVGKEIGRLTLPDECMWEVMEVLKKFIKKRKEYEEYYPQHKKMPSFTEGKYVLERDTNGPSEEEKVIFKEGFLIFEFVTFSAQGDSGSFIIIKEE